MVNSLKDDEAHRLTLLAMNETGYRNLTELISLAYEKGQNVLHDRAVILKDWIAAQPEGMIALSGAKEGEIGKALLAGSDEADALLAQWQEMFPQRFYLEDSANRPDQR